MNESKFLQIGNTPNTPESEVKKFFLKQYTKLFDKNPEIFEYVRRYKSDAYYIDVNGVARMGTGGFTEWLSSEGKQAEEVEERVEVATKILYKVEEFLRNSLLPRDITVYRQISNSTLKKIQQENGAFVDRGLVSTCFSLDQARKYHKPHTIRIDIPAGTRVIDMTSALQFTNWSESSTWENELVIDRGYSYDVVPEKNKDYILSLKLRGLN